jgi:AdoMet-dependent heme synthase
MSSKSIVQKHVSLAYEKLIPLFTTIELTQNCNFRCRHCYNFDRTLNSTPTDSRPTLSKNQVFKTLESLQGLGGLWLNLSGGEALLCPFFDEVVLKAKKLNFLVRLKTNAALLTPQKVEFLDKIGLDACDVTLYGASKETYNQFTGKDNFLSVLNAIEALNQSSIDLNINIILSKINIHEIDKMVEIARSRNIDFNFGEEITERYDKSQCQQELALDHNDYLMLLNSPFGEYFNHSNPEKSLQCGCAKVVLGINAYGDIFPCIGAPILAGNLQDQKLEEVWKDSPVFNKIRNLKEKDFKECQGCSKIEYCNRSSGATYINNGNYTGCDSYTYQYASARYLFNNGLMLATPSSLSKKDQTFEKRTILPKE